MEEIREQALRQDNMRDEKACTEKAKAIRRPTRCKKCATKRVEAEWIEKRIPIAWVTLKKLAMEIAEGGSWMEGRR